MINGHKCYIENGYLFAVALFDEQDERLPAPNQGSV